MGKEIAATREFPSQRRLEPCRIEGDKNKVRLAGEVPRRGISQLVDSREVNEAITAVVLRAVIRALHNGMAPIMSAADFVNQSHFSPADEIDTSGEDQAGQ